MSEGRLVTKNGTEVPIGTILESRDVKYKLIGWRVPHKISSTGRVFVINIENLDGFEEQFFPGVFDLKIVDSEFSRE